MEFLHSGRVVSSVGGLYEIDTDEGKLLSCKPRGKFRHEKIRLLAGDRVTVKADEQGNLFVDEISERKNFLLRPAIANVDILFVAAAAASPDPIFENIDKLTAIAEESNIRVVIVITKMDLSPESAAELAETYRKVGYTVFEVSATNSEGIKELRTYLKERCADGISVFAGASGVGKSTLLNLLFPQLSRKTGAVSERIGRGRHTTRSVNLFPFRILFGQGIGYIADTPGFSLLDFENFDFFTLEDLPYNFPEFRKYLGRCRYAGCTHKKEDGCAIIAKLKTGEIPPSRHQSYVMLYEQLKNKHIWNKV